MAPETRPRPKPPIPPKRGSRSAPALAGQKKSADTPKVRESGEGIVGIRLKPRGKLTTGRLTRILRAMALTPSKFAAWTGFTLKQYIDANPSWTERQVFELVQENYATIDQAETEG